MQMTSARILILRLSSIGDIILCSAFIRQIYKTFPNSQIDFVVKDQFKELVKYNPHLNNIYCIDANEGIKQLFKIRKILKNNNYTYVFDLHNNFRTRILLSGLFRHKKSKIKKSKIKRAMLVLFKWNLYKNMKSIPMRYLDVGKKVGIKDDKQGLEIYWDKKIEETLQNKYHDFINNEFIILAPGAGFYTKKWPIEYFIKIVEILINERKDKIIILGGPADIDDGRKLKISDRVIDLTGRLSLLESAIVLKYAKAVLSNDSGLMHIATAVKTPVVAIFGSTVEEFGFFPFRSKHCIIQNEDLSCRPCSHIGKYYCPKGHFKCMLEIEPPIVYDKLIKMI